MVRLFAPRWTGFDAGQRESLEKLRPSPPNVVEVRKLAWVGLGASILFVLFRLALKNLLVEAKQSLLRAARRFMKKSSI